MTIITTTETILFLYLVSMFLRPRNHHTVWFIIPTVIVIWLAHYGLQYVIPSNGKFLYTMLLDYLVTLVFYEFSGHGIFVVAIFETLYFVSQAVSISLVSQISGISPEDMMQSVKYSIISYTMFILILTFCIYFLDRFRWRENIQLSIKKWVTLFLLPAISLIFILLSFHFFRDHSASSWDVVGTSGFVLFVNLLFYPFFRDYSVKIKYAELLRVASSTIEKQKRYYQNLLEKNRIERYLVHDYKYHLEMLGSYAKAEDSKGALSIINKLLGYLQYPTIKRYTGNYEIDSILSSTLPLVESKGVKVSVIGILPKELPFDILDICVIVGNTVANAAKACEQVRNTAHYLSIRFSFKSNFFTMVCNNSTEYPISPKGSGLEIIQAICEANRGQCSFRYLNRNFQVSVFLQGATSLS